MLQSAAESPAFASQPGFMTMDGHAALCARCGAAASTDTGTDGAGEPGAPMMLGRLTAKEIEIFRYLQGGLSNKQIARRLLVSDNTVKFHLKHIYEKLGLSSRRRLAVDGLPGNQAHGPLAGTRSERSQSSPRS